MYALYALYALYACVGVLFLIVAVCSLLEIRRARTICSYCGSLECDGDCLDRARWREASAAHKLERGMQEQTERDLLSPWIATIEGL